MKPSLDELVELRQPGAILVLSGEGDTDRTVQTMTIVPKYPSSHSPPTRLPKAWPCINLWRPLYFTTAPEHKSPCHSTFLLDSPSSLSSHLHFHTQTHHSLKSQLHLQSIVEASLHRSLIKFDRKESSIRWLSQVSLDHPTSAASIRLLLGPLSSSQS